MGAKSVHVSKLPVKGLAISRPPGISKIGNDLKVT